MLDKKHIIREKKVKYVTVEKNVLNKLSHPLIVRLSYTFQDDSSLCKIQKSPFFRLFFQLLICSGSCACSYFFGDFGFLDFVLDYAKNGELLDFIKKNSSFDETCTKFYAAEIILAIEYLHGQNIIHRDLKPENILMDDKMHIKLTDFGTAKILEGNAAEEGATGMTPSLFRSSFARIMSADRIIFNPFENHLSMTQTPSS